MNARMKDALDETLILSEKYVAIAKSFPLYLDLETE